MRKVVLVSSAPDPEAILGHDSALVEVAVNHATSVLVDALLGSLCLTLLGLTLVALRRTALAFSSTILARHL